MPRAISGTVHRKRRSKVLKDVKGFYGGRKSLYRIAKDARRKALQNEYKDRKRKKREFRGLWIQRISAAASIMDISYSKLIGGLNSLGVKINRKMLAEIAVSDIEAFKKIVDKAESK